MPGAAPSDAILKGFAELNVWPRRDERAPHKPLVLYALARLQGGNNRLRPFDELEEPLTRFLGILAHLESPSILNCLSITCKRTESGRSMATLA